MTSEEFQEDLIECMDSEDTASQIRSLLCLHARLLFEIQQALQELKPRPWVGGAK